MTWPKEAGRSAQVSERGNKRYYWLKLKRDFFKRHDIRIIESQENGKDYVLFYLKMLLESIDHEGELRFSAAIPYDEKMLSIITNTNIDIVRAAMNMFIGLQMIEVMDDKTIFMSEVTKLIGSETSGAERVRKHRAKLESSKALLQCNTEVTKCNTEIDIEKELEKDTELEKEKGYGADAPTPTPVPPKKAKPERHKYGEYGWVLLTLEQHARLLADLGPEELSRCIKYIDESAQSNGNKNKWRDWNLVIRRCSREGWGRNIRQSAPAKPDTLGILNRMMEESK
jgi:predicted phage replisome organizer